MTKDQLAWIDGQLGLLTEEGLRRQRTLRSSPQAATSSVAGETLVNFASNDYLGLAADSRVIAAAAEAMAQAGLGSGASPLVGGYSSWQKDLESELASFCGVEAALVFPCGYSANLGTVAALVGPQDAVFGDKLNHASLIDGCRLSGAYFRTFRHRDYEHLEQRLKQAARFRRRLIATDSVFSMDGDVADLVELTRLAQHYDAMLLVDEAHATGVLGPGGRGLAALQGVSRQVDVHIGTLSKALGSAGGFVAGSASLVEWLIHKARSFIYSTAGTVANQAAALAALRILKSRPCLQESLLRNADWFRHQLLDLGGNLSPAIATPIVPILLGEAQAALELSQTLRSLGFWIPAIRPPTVPPGTARLRVSLTAGHDQATLQRLLAALSQLQEAGRLDLV